MVFHGFSWFQVGFSCFFMVFHGSRCEARHETYRTPKLVTTRRSILGPLAECRPGPSDYKGKRNHNLSKAFTAPSVITKPVFFIVEYSSMLLILGTLISWAGVGMGVWRLEGCLLEKPDVISVTRLIVKRSCCYM